MGVWEDRMEGFFELEDFKVGMVATTPLGRRVIVVKHLLGTSKIDCFSRILCRYEGGGTRDYVTLQPHQLTPVPVEQGVVAPVQLSLFS
jgi:hypothetical protein